MDEIRELALPRHFGDVLAEYRALVDSAALIDFADRSLLQLTGPDRVSYLQGLVSNDVKKLLPFGGIPATFLNQQGKVLGEVNILCSENSLYLQLEDAIKQKILAHLDRYLVADEVVIEDRSAEYRTLGLRGPRAADLLSVFTAAAWPVTDLAHTMTSFEGSPVCIVRENDAGGAGFDVIAHAPALPGLAANLGAGLAGIGGRWAGTEAVEIARVESGVPRYGIDFTEEHLLLEAGLDRHVSFSKGCYLGQEIIERIRSRGHVNKRLCRLFIAGREPPRPGAALRVGENAVGAVTSSVLSPHYGQAVAIGFVHREYWAPGTNLKVDHDGRSVAAQVGDLLARGTPLDP